MHDGASSGSFPLAFHLTFHPYGTWLAGDPRGWHRRGRERRHSGSRRLLAHGRRRLRHPVVTFDAAAREIVRAAIVETCAHRGWTIHALAVERAHVHVVLTARVAPERIVQQLKAWATRHLRRHGLLVGHPHPWAEHGSTRYLFEPDYFQYAIAYVLSGRHRGLLRR